MGYIWMPDDPEPYEGSDKQQEDSTRKLVREKVMGSQISHQEKTAIIAALDAGAAHGYGNVIAWLTTEWACRLRDKFGLSDADAIIGASGMSPYPLPPKTP